MMSPEYQREYGQWAGNPRGQKPDLSKCAKGVYSNGSYIESQCCRARGHGPDQAYCKQHAKKKEKNNA